jgi:hypoxanthine phosphoribosyltransferase
MRKYFVSHDYIYDLIQIIKTNPSTADIDYIIGASRGGLVPAVWISHALDKPLLTVNLQSYKKTKQSEITWLQKFDPDIIMGKNLLIVDDICDTGNTFNEIKKVCVNAKSIQFAAIVQKTQIKDAECYTALLSHPTADVWYVFPWEVKEYE